jgi:hypothetical protein
MTKGIAYLHSKSHRPPWFFASILHRVILVWCRYSLWSKHQIVGLDLFGFPFIILSLHVVSLIIFQNGLLGEKYWFNNVDYQAPSSAQKQKWIRAYHYFGQNEGSIILIMTVMMKFRVWNILRFELSEIHWDWSY